MVQKQTLQIMHSLQKLEQNLNKLNQTPYLTYQAGYYAQSVCGGYFYVNEFMEIDDYFSEGFFVRILQKNGHTSYGRKPTKQQVKAVNQFKNQMYRKHRIGDVSTACKDYIQLNPDPWGEYEDWIIHP